MPPTVTSVLPVEVELAVQVMPCQAMRRSYDSTPRPHPCAYFAEWGVYHSYDYAKAGPPDLPSTVIPVVSAGKRPVIPELLSGCRKSPILCIGINPNLPGWTESTRNAIHPYLDDVLQYAHYFRFRTRDKLRVPDATYETLIGTSPDSPKTTKPLITEGQDIPVERAPVLMYEQYQTLLDGLAQRKGWAPHKLAVGEDISYANMVACPSTRWVVTPNDEDPSMPVMGRARATGIVSECFFERKYFLRQLMQSLPAVILVFSRTTAREFITALAPRFSKGNPKATESLTDLFAREIRLRYGQLTDGTVLDARVIFMPHASARPEEFAELRGPCVDRLVEEVDRGNLVFNAQTGHLKRGRGGCVFCVNALYAIGQCDYEAELKPLAPGVVQPLAASGSGIDPLAERAEQQQLLDAFMAPAPSELVFGPMGVEAPAPPMALRGSVVTMAGTVLPSATVYVQNRKIVDIRESNAAAPAGFPADAPRVDTGGVIYPGLIDLHNHLPYNILPLWNPPARFDNRDQWRARREYRRDVSEPMDTLTGGGPDILKAIIRYIEVKLLMGGVTSGQGMRSRFGGNRFYQGMVRNFEVSDDPVLRTADSRVLDVDADGAADFGRALDRGRIIFYHLSEGLDARARQHYTVLEQNGLLRSNLVGIHSLALRPAQFRQLATAKTSVVWSPLSNSILYGSTVNPKTLVDSGVRFGLGSDWTPSGSRNLLFELKVAWLHSQQLATGPGFEQLAGAVTRHSAAVVGWDGALGSLEAGKFADLLVLDARHSNVFENLVKATERDIRLVTIDGHVRYGDAPLLTSLGRPAAAGLESVTVGGRAKRLNLAQEGSPLAGLTFAAARQTLETAMSDLAGLRANPITFGPLANELTIELDMQAIDADVALPMAPPLPPLDRIPLDPPTVIDDPGYFDALEGIPHLPDFLKGRQGLRGFYI